MSFELFKIFQKVTNNSKCYLKLNVYYFKPSVFSLKIDEGKMATVSLTMKYDTCTHLTNLTPSRNIFNPFGIYHNDLAHLRL